MLPSMIAGTERSAEPTGQVTVPASRWDVVAEAIKTWAGTLRLCLILLAAGSPATTAVIWLLAHR
jgi:hypothetical protein